MGFEPFDTSLIVQRLANAVPALQAVGNMADYAAVQELRSFRTPSAYVVFGEEQNTGKVPASIGVCTQESVVEIGVVLALRHYREQGGGQMAAQTRQLIGQVRCALLGWRPEVSGARVLEWQAGRVLDYDAGVLLFADRYVLRYLLHKESTA
ncbi:hypothetical protein EBQ26_10525 [Allofranklinella schreckenbergeri]|uniref:Uncharacterized protein n=2 Tax=Comamonadaceae TaxID=80864 RepID=A0A2A2AQA6_9BURK|nr:MULTISPECIES: hypothetical protein [Comamonadaceae]PAT39902.1 hypothetical protein CK621_14410 [Vandammella animalimorsus]RMW96032.1 hypothetical protein EBQ26_10525 [Allofranklinella schreckenbergeri]